jgi:hypothetical protein
MAERIATRYRRLIEVRILHHYWLDEGSQLFDEIPEPVPGQRRKEGRLLKYDVRSFLSLNPTAATDKLIKGLNCIYGETPLGFVVGAPDDLVVPLDAHFDFAVTVSDASFFNYTSLTLRPQKIYEVYYKPEDKIYRYKENVPVFSNVTGVSMEDGNVLFLSKEYPAIASDRIESFFKTGNALMQLTSDAPPLTTQQLYPRAANVPVFFHQGDVPVIVPPDGLVGAPERGVLLSSDLSDDVFALISLSATGRNYDDFRLIERNGTLSSQEPVFQIRFKNRSTIWSYFDKKSRLPISSEPGPFPLTFFGNAGSKQKPSMGPVKILQTGNQITNLVSEIFV